MKNIGAPPKKDETKTESNENKTTNFSAADTFTSDQLHEKWMEFANSIQGEKPRMFQLLKAHLPELHDEFIISLCLEGEGQIKDFSERIQNDLIGFLKKSLNNYKIELKVSVQDEETKQKLVYTSTDKYNYLAEKNDLLNKLKQLLNLDID